MTGRGQRVAPAGGVPPGRSFWVRSALRRGAHRRRFGSRERAIPLGKRTMAMRGKGILSELTWPVAMAYSLYCRTLRYETVNLAGPYRLARRGQPMVIALWHNEQFPLAGWGIRLRLKFVTMVSASRDGEILARLLGHLGLESVRGSSSRLGASAVRAAERVMLRERRLAVITVDGPQGPKHLVKPGAIYLARKTGALLVPLRITMPDPLVFANSWDQFRVPYPGTRCRVHVGEPYKVTDEPLTRDVLRRECRLLERKLRALAPSD